MTFKEFSQYVEQLQNMYQQILNETQAKVWFENLKGLSIERFNYILAEIYKTNTHMPSLAEILAKHKSIPYENRTQETFDGEKCDICGNSGYITYNKVIDGYPYLHVATCSCGRMKPYEDEKYKMKTAEELGFTNKPNVPSEEEIIQAMIKLSNSGLVSEGVKEIVRQNILKRRRQTKGVMNK